MFEFSAQDSDLEYLFYRTKNPPVSSELKPPLVSTRKFLVIFMNRNQHIFSARSTILLLQMTERNQWVLMSEHNGSKFFFEVAFYHSTFYILAPTIYEKIIHAYVGKYPVKRQTHKIRMVLQKRFLPIVLKSGNLAPFMEMGYFHVPKVPLMLTLRCQLWKSH